MSKNTKEERLRWILPVYNKQIKLVNTVKICPYSQRSLERWFSAYKKYGEKELEPKSTRPKINPRETPVRIKEKIIQLRKETKLGVLKLHWKLKKQGINIHPGTIGKIIKKEGLTRKYRTKKIRYKYLKAPLQAGELAEIDVKYVPQRIEGRRYYQFTAIDYATRWRYLNIYDDSFIYSALKFLKELIGITSFKIRAIKTNNESYFTNRYTGYLKSSDPLNPRLHPFDLLCQELDIIHYLIDPGKPQQNGKVERSH